MITTDPLATYLGRHAARALTGLRQVGDGLPPELVHDTRTSLRRLRATLRTLPAAVEDPGAADATMRRVALALGRVRDADVLRALLLSQLEALSRRPDPPALEAVRADLATALTTERELALEALQREDHHRREAIELLERWCLTLPPMPPLDPASLLERSRARVRTRIAQAEGDAAALHSARKAAKRWRYAAELLAPLTSEAAEHLAQAERVQEVLGQVQDRVIAAEFLRRHAELGTRSPGSHAIAEQLLTAQETQLAELTAQTRTLFEPQP